jgi:hypothetical protein
MKALVLPLALGAGLVTLFAMSSSSSGAAPAAPEPTRPPPTPVKPTTGSATHDLVISVYALRASTWAQAWPAPPAPRLVEWSGEVKPGSVHPTWAPLASRLRDASGQLLPALLRAWGAQPNRIAVCAFSAGSNSGLRELLRSEADRERIDAAFSIDGLHPQIAADGSFVDPSQVNGLRAYMARAAAGRALFALTASAVAAPGASIGQSADVLRRLITETAEARGLEPPAPPMAWRSVAPPPAALAAQLEPLGIVDAASVGGLSAWWFTGSDAAAHIRQANAVQPLLIRELLVPRWRASGSLLI